MRSRGTILWLLANFPRRETVYEQGCAWQKCSFSFSSSLLFHHCDKNVISSLLFLFFFQTCNWISTQKIGSHILVEYRDFSKKIQIPFKKQISKPCSIEGITFNSEKYQHAIALVSNKKNMLLQLILSTNKIVGPDILLKYKKKITLLRQLRSERALDLDMCYKSRLDILWKQKYTNSSKQSREN